MKTHDNEQRDMNSRYKCLSPKTNYAFSSKGKNTEESENIENKRDNKLNDSRTSKKSSVSVYLERRHRESQEKLNKLRAEINYYQENDMTFKPKISDNSQKIVERLVEDRQYDFNEIISQTNTNINTTLNCNNKILNQRTMNSSTNIHGNAIRERNKVKAKNENINKTNNITSSGPIKLIDNRLKNDTNKSNHIQVNQSTKVSKDVNKYNNHANLSIQNNYNNVNRNQKEDSQMSNVNINNNSFFSNKKVVLWKDTATEDLLNVVQSRKTRMDENKNIENSKQRPKSLQHKTQEISNSNTNSSINQKNQNIRNNSTYNKSYIENSNYSNKNTAYTSNNIK